MNSTMDRFLRNTANGLLAAMLIASAAGPVGVFAAKMPSGKDDRDRDRARDQDRDHDRDERTPIQHVVVIFQENVSFDHYFATYPTATNGDGSPFTARPGTPLVNGLFPGGLLDHNPNTLLGMPAEPFRLGHAQAATCDQDHGYTDEQKAFAAGAMNEFPDTVGVGGSPCLDYGHGKALVMGYYDGNTVTALWNYAQHYAMSDNSYSTTFGPSTPGALNLIAGQTHGARIAADIYAKFGSASGNITAVDGAGVGSVIGDPRPDPLLDNCTLPSNVPPGTPRTYIRMAGRNIGDLLNERRITWGWFQGGFRPAPNGNAALGNVPGAATEAAGATTPMFPATGLCGSAHTSIAGAGASFDYIPHHQPFQYFPQTANPQHLPPSSAAMIGHTDRANHQYDLQDFQTALTTGHLPAVSFVKAAAYQDGHAGYSTPLDEQAFLVETINQLMQSPEWEHTAVIVLYDDSDGWYDHQMGPIVHQSNALNPVSGLPDDAMFGSGRSANCGAPTAGEFNGRCGYGPRQPFLVISPWARQNVVDHRVTDQSSVIRFIEDNWDLGRIGNQSADAIAGGFGGLLDFDESHKRAPRLILDPFSGSR